MLTKSDVNDNLGFDASFLFSYSDTVLSVSYIDISPTTVKTSAKARLKTALPVFDCGLNKPCLCAAQ